MDRLQVFMGQDEIDPDSWTVTVYRGAEFLRGATLISFEKATAWAANVVASERFRQAAAG